ncbi:hypothetical protein P389DRAFT_179910 [Cystobasidium minutum MCA 4210]|uniref:uncharacterized protein n=1 Tax=Cystobasidium minutum MCA 4210 TaxID=1397322 RepID=UPI0034CD690C|eukprot:jgi/Rhomi1/179910/fgenesh1_pg.4_\
MRSSSRDTAGRDSYDTRNDRSRSADRRRLSLGSHDDVSSGRTAGFDSGSGRPVWSPRRSAFDMNADDEPRLSSTTTKASSRRDDRSPNATTFGREDKMPSRPNYISSPSFRDRSTRSLASRTVTNEDLNATLPSLTSNRRSSTHDEESKLSLPRIDSRPRARSSSQTRGETGGNAASAGVGSGSPTYAAPTPPRSDSRSEDVYRPRATCIAQNTMLQLGMQGLTREGRGKDLAYVTEVRMSGWPIAQQMIIADPGIDLVRESQQDIVMSVLLERRQSTDDRIYAGHVNANINSGRDPKDWKKFDPKKFE